MGRPSIWPPHPRPRTPRRADPADSAVDERAADTATAGPHTPPSEQPPRTADSSSDNQAAEIAQLRRALQTHPAIDIARGILMASFQLTSQQSWQVLVAASQHSNIKLHLIADALLQAIDGQALPEPLAGHLARAGGTGTTGTRHPRHSRNQRTQAPLKYSPRGVRRWPGRAGLGVEVGRRLSDRACVAYASGSSSDHSTLKCPAGHLLRSVFGLRQLSEG
ncbi:ANTAR domain-containing protein [Streptomyces maoxianensis]|uniref:ANTAR domain-containing protein n=1 Tax=Streptomyces maoxianensis TaxID=1459942 RepID=A0ABV9GGA3_9ACTN